MRIGATEKQGAINLYVIWVSIFSKGFDFIGSYRFYERFHESSGDSRDNWFHYVSDLMGLISQFYDTIGATDKQGAINLYVIWCKS